MPARELRVALVPADYEAAIALYRDGLGLSVLEDWNGPSGRGLLLDAGRATLELLSPELSDSVDNVEVGRREATPVRLAFEVEDPDDSARRLAAEGATLLGGPVLTPWRHRNARLSTPDRLQITLFSPMGDATQDSPRDLRRTISEPRDEAGPSWPASLDAIHAAPSSHRLILADRRLRVLEVLIEPGIREPEHTHRWPSTMVIDRPARIRYYRDGVPIFESPDALSDEPRIERLGPEGPHAVENIDNHPYHAIRIEIRDD